MSCSKCKRRGHVARTCHSSNAQVTRDDDPHEDHFELDVIYISELRTILFESDVIVVPDDCAPWILCNSGVIQNRHWCRHYCDWQACVLLTQEWVVNKTLLNYPGERLPVPGGFIGFILKDGEQCKFNLLVVDSAHSVKRELRTLYSALNQKCWISHPRKGGGWAKTYDWGQYYKANWLNPLLIGEQPWFQLSERQVVRICVKSVRQGNLHKFAKCRWHCPKVSRS